MACAWRRAGLLRIAMRRRTPRNPSRFARGAPQSSSTRRKKAARITRKIKQSKASEKDLQSKDFLEKKTQRSPLTN